jgi:hypothetical protein
VTRSDHRHGARDCPSCCRLVDLDRHGHFRRHLAIAPDGRRHLCVASGRGPDGVMQLLTVQLTPQERYSHALSLLRSATAPPSQIAAEGGTG